MWLYTPPGHVHVHHLGTKLGVLKICSAGNNARLDDFLAVVHVVDEAVERIDALHQPGSMFATIGGNDAWNQVERNQALGSGAISSLAPYTAKVMPTRRKIISASSRRACITSSGCRASQSAYAW